MPTIEAQKYAKDMRLAASHIIQFAARPGVSIVTIYNRPGSIAESYPVDADAHYAEGLAKMVDEQHPECAVVLAKGMRYAGINVGKDWVVVVGCPVSDPILKSLPRAVKRLGLKLEELLIYSR